MVQEKKKLCICCLAILLSLENKIDVIAPFELSPLYCKTPFRTRHIRRCCMHCSCKLKENRSFQFDYREFHFPGAQERQLKINILCSLQATGGSWHLSCQLHGLLVLRTISNFPCLQSVKLQQNVIRRCHSLFCYLRQPENLRPNNCIKWNFSSKS